MQVSTPSCILIGSVVLAQPMVVTNTYVIHDGGMYGRHLANTIKRSDRRYGLSKDLEVAAVESLDLEIEVLVLSSWQEGAVGVRQQVGIADSRKSIHRREDAAVAPGMAVLMFLSLVLSLYSLQQSTLPQPNNRGYIITWYILFGPFHIGIFYFKIPFRKCHLQENFRWERSTFEINHFQNSILQYQTCTILLKKISGIFLLDFRNIYFKCKRKGAFDEP